MTFRALGLTVPVALLCLAAGCDFWGDRLTSWEKSQLESQTEADLDEFLDQFDELGGALDEVSSARGGDSHWENCVVGYAGCQRCYSVDGNSEGGTASMEQVLGDDVLDCSASITLNDVLVQYTIDEWWWTGTWSVRPDALYDVAWNGTARSTLLIQGSSNSDGTYDYEYTMNAASAVTDGAGDLQEWSVDFDYQGLFDQDWHVDCARDASGAITGTVTGNSASCTISGQDYDFVVSCE